MRNDYTNTLFYAVGFAVLFSIPHLMAAGSHPDSVDDVLEQLTSTDCHWLDHALRRYTVSGKREMQAMIDRFPAYEGWITQELHLAQLPHWLKYITLAESRLELSVHSPAGAAGLWQLMPRTGRSLGLRIDREVDERLDPIRSTQAAAQLLHELYREFDDWLLTLAAYNAGPGAVRRAQRRAGANDYPSIRRYLPGQTRRYIPRVLAVAQVAMDPRRFDLTPASDTKPLLVRTTAHAVRLSELAQQYGLAKAELLQLNPSFRKRRVPAGSRFFLPNTFSPCSQPPTVAGIGTWLHYQARFGETLHQISQHSGYPIAALKAWNKLDSTLIYPGQTIFIPSVRAVSQTV